MFLPESPRWLIDHDQSAKALRTLARLHFNGDVEDPYVQAEYEIITTQILDEHENATKSFKELFKKRANARRIITACVCQASAQMTGVSAFQYFSPAIFDQMELILAELCCIRALTPSLANWLSSFSSSSSTA